MKGVMKLTALLISLYFCSNAQSASDRDPERLLVAGLVFSPYIIQESDGSVHGIIVDIVREVGKRVGLRVDFAISNWARAFHSAQHGHIDALIPTMKSKDREQFLYYPAQPLLNLDMVLVKKRNREIGFNGTMDSLKNYQIAWIRKGRVSPAFDKAREEGVITVVERNTPSIAIKGVAYGRVDLAATDRLLGIWAAQKEGLSEKIEMVTPILGSVPVYLALSKSRISLSKLKRVDAALAEIHQDGTFKQILHRYLGDTSNHLLAVP